jgi:hypothetical protein
MFNNIIMCKKTGMILLIYGWSRGSCQALTESSQTYGKLTFKPETDMIKWFKGRYEIIGRL